MRAHAWLAHSTWTNNLGLLYLIALDVAGETARSFQIYPLPTSFVVNQNGMIRYLRVGQITAQEVESLCPCWRCFGWYCSSSMRGLGH